MRFLYQSSTFLRVNRTGGDELRAECTLISNDCEAVGFLTTDVRQLAVQEAGWAVYRSNESPIGYYPLPEMKDMQAYLDAGPALKTHLGQPGKELARELIAECVRGIIQGETFFYQERGFDSIAAYDAFWDKLYVNSCYYYSHLDRIEKPWMEYVGYETRPFNLFNRSKTVTVRDARSGYTADAVFLDSFHELSVSFTVNGEGIVQEQSADYVSAPDAICHENTRHMSLFAGKNLPELSKKEIAGLAGGGEGCSHLVDLIHEASGALKKVIAQKGR